jgi:hypothetical protein
MIPQANMLVGIAGGLAMLSRWWDWLKDDANQGALRIIGASFAAIVIAGWAAYLHFYPAPIQKQQPVASETVFHVCRGEVESECKPHVYFIGCEDIDKWAAIHCAPDWRAVTIDDWAGGRCGGFDIRLACTHK